MGSFTIWTCVYNPIHSSSHSSCSKVHLNIMFRMYGSFGPPFLWMKSTSSSQCVTSVCQASSSLGARTISLPFDTEQITTMNIVFGNSGSLLLAFLLTWSPKSIVVHWLPCLPYLLASQISLAHFFKNISNLCRPILFALSKLLNGSQPLNVAKQSATTIT